MPNLSQFSCFVDSASFSNCCNKFLNTSFVLYATSVTITGRGGFEDTRLEAKDTKKIRGQGQPFRGQTLSRPRTGMLEAKDQGHKRKCSQKKKKVFTKIFQAISTKKRFPKNFSSAPQNFNNSKIVLSSSRGQANFRGLEASRPRPRTLKCVLEDSTSDYWYCYWYAVVESIV